MSTTAESRSRPGRTDPAPEPDRIVLHDIPWSVYVRLRDADNRRGVRMAYWNGTLELVSPLFRHEKYSERIAQLIRTVAIERDIPCSGAGSTTLQRRGRGRKKGAGKEPDTSFYFAHEASVRDKDDINLGVDPPPDLAVEVDNTNDSAGKLPIYAALGVPEVWRFDAETWELWFGVLQPDGSYAPADRGVSLPMLTPALAVEALRLCQGVSESRWGRMLRDWVRERLVP